MKHFLNSAETSVEIHWNKRFSVEITEIAKKRSKFSLAEQNKQSKRIDAKAFECSMIITMNCGRKWRKKLSEVIRGLQSFTHFCPDYFTDRFQMTTSYFGRNYNRYDGYVWLMTFWGDFAVWVGSHLKTTNLLGGKTVRLS